MLLRVYSKLNSIEKFKTEYVPLLDKFMKIGQEFDFIKWVKFYSEFYQFVFDSNSSNYLENSMIF